MTVSYRFGDVDDTHGATLRARGASLGTEYHAIVRGLKLRTAASNVAGSDSAVGSSEG
jgi:hypothetical protein